MATVVAALAGSAALILIEGEAGIGKSRLVDECLATPNCVTSASCWPSAPTCGNPSRSAPWSTGCACSTTGCPRST